MSDNEKIKELIKLSEENPELPIFPATFNEVVCEDWGYWLGRIGKVEKSFIYFKDETWHAGNRSDILDEISNDLSDYPEYENIPEKDFLKHVEDFFDYQKSEDKIKEAIIIYIELP